MIRKTIFLCTLGALFSLAADAPLVAHYDLNENSGTVVNNRQGTAGRGEFRGPAAWAPALQGKGIRLDGATNSVLCGRMPELDESKGMTLLVWFKATHPMGLRVIASAENPESGEGWRFGIDNNKLISVLPADAAGDNWSDGLWHLGALVIQGREVREYMDGKLIREARLEKPVRLNAGAELAIGSLTGKDLGGFHGIIDDVKIYNGILSSSEIDGEFKRLIKTPQNNPELEFRRNMIAKTLGSVDVLPDELKAGYREITSRLAAIPLAVRGAELEKSMRSLDALAWRRRGSDISWIRSVCAGSIRRRCGLPSGGTVPCRSGCRWSGARPRLITFSAISCCRTARFPPKSGWTPAAVNTSRGSS